MPSGYESYLHDSLCQSGDDSPNFARDGSSSASRRKSFGETLPQITLILEGHGRSVTLKVRPHVRWTKALAKWSATFDDPQSAPMAWPAVVTFPGSTKGEIQLSSIQETISRTLGPELLEAVTNSSPSMVVKIGVQKQSKMNEDIADIQETPQAMMLHAGDVQGQVSGHVDGPLNGASVPEDQVLQEPSREPFSEHPTEEQSTQYKVCIIADFLDKGMKMRVSSNCTVGRLREKFLAATKSSRLFSDWVLEYGGIELSDFSKKLKDVLPSSLVEERGGLLFRRTEVAPTPPPRKQRRRRESEDDRRTAEISTVENPTESFSPNWEDDNYDEDLALAIALSLSEQKVR